MRRARVDQRAPERLKERTVLQSARAVFGDLARSTGDHILVALATTLRVVSGSKTVRDLFDLFEDEPIVVKRPQRHNVIFGDAIKVRPLRIETIADVIKTRGRLCRATLVRTGFCPFKTSRARMTESISSRLIVAPRELAIHRERIQQRDHSKRREQHRGYNLL